MFQAVLLETQRYSNIVPNGIPHSCRSDIKVNGITLPAGTMVLPLFEEIFKGDQWLDGMVFNPKRFIDAEGKLVRPADFLPYSTGRRKCIGEKLAGSELFMIFSSIVQKFEIYSENEIAEQMEIGFINIPKNFKIHLRRRNSKE